MKKPQLRLTAADKTHLEKLLSKDKLPVRTFKRATALLALGKGMSLTAVAELTGVVYQTVSEWCKKYKTDGLSFLDDQPRSGRPIEIDGVQRAKITALACSEAPEGYERWSLRLLADKAVELGYCEHLSYSYASKILKKHSQASPEA